MNPTQVQIWGYHCDAYGHVNNARYLEFLEEARWNLLSGSLDEGPLAKRNLLLVVVNLSISYKKALNPGDVVEVWVDSCELHAASITFKQHIQRGVDLCAEAEVRFVLLDPSTQKASRIDEEISAQFKQLVANA